MEVHNEANDNTEVYLKAENVEDTSPTKDDEKNKLKQCMLDVTPKIIEDYDAKLKERVTQCKNMIASLKLELNEEKMKIEKETKATKLSQTSDASAYSYTYSDCNTSDNRTDLFSTNVISACIDNKFNCDEHLLEYEKQLQRYQDTLNMAQIEKKNAIRKQMLAKAYKLKLLEVENQCNIELLRIKQSLQCLEPLQMIAEKWKNSTNDNIYNLDNFELIPRFPELNATSGSDIVSISVVSENKMAITTETNDTICDSI